MSIFASMFEKEIKEYELVRKEYQQKIADKVGQQQWMEYNEILFSAHSCAIEGNSFTVDDTRILREQGMAMIPVGRSLLECTEMADHFRAFDYMASHLDLSFDETLLKEENRLLTEHTLGYRASSAIAGEYITEDMASGDTVFGDHSTLIARIPNLMASTQKALDEGQHPLVVAAKWHGYYEYLHPSRDGNAGQDVCSRVSSSSEPIIPCLSSASKIAQPTFLLSSRSAQMSISLPSSSKPQSLARSSSFPKNVRTPYQRCSSKIILHIKTN